MIIKDICGNIIVYVQMYLRGKLHGTKCFAYDYRMGRAYAMTTTPITTCKSTYHILTKDDRRMTDRCMHM